GALGIAGGVLKTRRTERASDRRSVHRKPPESRPGAETEAWVIYGLEHANFTEYARQEKPLSAGLHPAVGPRVEPWTAAPGTQQTSQITAIRFQKAPRLVRLHHVPVACVVRAREADERVGDVLRRGHGLGIFAGIGGGAHAGAGAAGVDQVGADV